MIYLLTHVAKKWYYEAMEEWDDITDEEKLENTRIHVEEGNIIAIADDLETFSDLVDVELEEIVNVDDVDD